MKRLIVSIAVVLVGCQSAEPPEKLDAGKRRASPALPLEAGARFVARGAAGEEHELKLRALTVDVATQPGTVHSHLRMEIASTADGQSEALIRLPVPRGAAVTDAILWMNDKPMRGAFVERQRARDIYTSIVTRRRDPALVTWDSAGWITVSIFPLEKDKARRFELEWIEPAAVVAGQIQYRVPVVAEQERLVGRAALKVDGRRMASNGRELVSIGPADPHKMFTRRAPGDPFQQVMMREADAVGAPHFVLVAETSQMMNSGGRERQRAILDALFDELPADAKLTILSADWDVSPIIEEATVSAAWNALAKLDAIPSAGALDLERALREAATTARKTGAGAVLFVGVGWDGFKGDATSGPTAELRQAQVRLSVAGVGDSEVIAPLARAAADTGGEAIALRDLDASLPLVIDALRPRRAAVAASDDGEWHRLRTVTGEAVWIGRALHAPANADPETIDAVAGSPLAGDLASLWDRARLEWHDRDPGEALARVLTPVTALLVLESDADYRRFGVDVPERVDTAQAERVRHRGEEGKMGKRGGEGLYGLRGPADDPDPHLAGRLAEEQARNAGILGVLKQSDGSRLSSTFGRDTAAGNDGQNVLGGLVGNQIGESYGVGGLGLVGTGSSGGGTGEGTTGLGNLGTIGKGGVEGGNGSGYGRGAGGLGGKRAKAPDVIPGQANVRGNLDKEIVRRIIRRHINEVRYCYDQQLARFPGLRGRVMVQFTIAASGQVIASVLQNSTVANGAVENCIVMAVRRWEFPKPLGGSIVIVSYPFVLTPSGGEEEDRAAAPGLPVVSSREAVIDQALAILAKGAGPEQIERISSLLGLRRMSSAEVLAWSISRFSTTFERRQLVARLLEASKRHHDAVRVLSESAPSSPELVAAELRSMDADAEAAEVLRLAKR
ncbi:MAG TPA: AgmX/PglI C-terminal domain-containing protein [Polyangia bacterium]|jgi:hypothetical protein